MEQVDDIANGKETFRRSKEYHRSRKNLGKYSINQIVIMVINGKWETILCNQVDYRNSMCLLDSSPPRHALLIELIIVICSSKTDLFLGAFKRK